jgi:NTP pyrophosphatase (non-canonical NTP hydrolase)
VSDITLAELLEFSEERIENETEGFQGDIPDHGARMIASYSTDLLQTLSTIEVQEAREDVDDPTDEYISEAVADDLVNVLMAVMATALEHDVDLGEAAEEHVEFVRDYHEMHEALADVETQDEAAEVFDEHMGDHAEANPIAEAEQAMDMTSIEPGDNVDDDEYDHDREDKSYA